MPKMPSLIKKGANLGVTLEKVARDFTLKKVDAAEARREARAATDDDSSLRWGGEANFNLDDPPSRTVTIIRNPPPDEPPGERPVKIYNEVGRETQTVKVYDPNDESIWVEIKRITRIRFQGPEEWDVQFNLDWSNEG